MINRSTEKLLYVTAIVTLALAACGGNPVGSEPGDVVFADTLGIDLDDFTETESGLFYRDDVVGTGAVAVAGDDATVTFTGWLVDGTEFDTGSFTALIGPSSRLIPGFNEGVIGMRVGGTRTLVIPADLGFGSNADVVIPKDAVLVFEVTLDMLVTP